MNNEFTQTPLIASPLVVADPLLGRHSTEDCNQPRKRSDRLQQRIGQRRIVDAVDRHAGKLPAASKNRAQGLPSLVRLHDQ
ncbi:hypothetical protein IHE39_02050 [Aminobacter carboxidus]|uniref:Uncharacterized protein n=1 Tax=Aminobacter carboxidus TaxID=376165 RepID=A0ABR9GHC6_9HYPH|nr:hypothetical protein [Aminobacter lissarensis]MBE1203067.1 hypothetical protein [Aminobacter carboxidus]